MPKVSVIIPVYNSAPYLEECLDSVYAQSLDDYEVICVDDGSTDSSGDILSLHAEKGRIRLIRQSNKGVSAARNTGLAAACGDYVYFMDSGDTIKPDMLKKMLDRAVADDLDIVLCNGHTWTASEEYKETVYEQNALMNRSHEYAGVYSGDELMVLMYENHEYWMTQWLQLYRRAFLEAKGLSFYEGIIHEDNLFSFVCMLSALRCGYIADVLYDKRIRPDSITTRHLSFDNAYGYFICYLEMKRFLTHSKREGKNPAAEAIMYSCLDEGRRVYAKLDSDEKYRYYSLPYAIQVEFRTSVADYTENSLMDMYPDSAPAEQTRNNAAGSEADNAMSQSGDTSSLKSILLRKYRILRKIFHRLLPSSRYNVTWNYQHLTAQLQVQTQMLSHLMSMDYHNRKRLMALEKKINMISEGKKNDR